MNGSNYIEGLTESTGDGFTHHNEFIKSELILDPTDIKQRLQGWIDALEPTDHGWEECNDALKYIETLEEQVELLTTLHAEAIRFSMIERSNYANKLACRTRTI